MKLVKNGANNADLVIATQAGPEGSANLDKFAVKKSAAQVQWSWVGMMARTQSAGSALVKLRGDYSELDEELEWDDLEGVLVCGFEDDGAGCSGLLDLQPTGGTDAPAVAGFKAGEAVLGHGGGEIVAESLGGGEEGRVDDAADGVDAEVFGAGLAAAGAVEAGHRARSRRCRGAGRGRFYRGIYGVRWWAWLLVAD